MKILVIQHTAWTEMICHAWRLAGADVRAVPVPVAALQQEPGRRQDVARELVRAIRVESPQLIVDVNAVAILPLDKDCNRWTVDESGGVPWCAWWWDAPHLRAAMFRAASEQRTWRRVLAHPSVNHFIWDVTLGREYSRWLQRPFHYLPTATHPGFFHPDAAGQSTRSFQEYDLTFLGTYFGGNEDGDSQELAALSAERIRRPDCSYFELAERPDSAWPIFSKTLLAGLKHEDGFLQDDIMAWKTALDRRVLAVRRIAPLESILQARVPACFFAGTGWPNRFKAESTPFYQPAHLVALYRRAAFNLDLGNGQGFTGGTMRAYEIMAAGGVLLCRSRPEFDPTGEHDGKVYLSYAAPSDILRILETCRNNRFLLQNLRDNARQFVLGRHTWAHRLNDLLGNVGES